MIGFKKYILCLLLCALGVTASTRAEFSQRGNFNNSVFGSPYMMGVGPGNGFGGGGFGGGGFGGGGFGGGGFGGGGFGGGGFGGGGGQGAQYKPNETVKKIAEDGQKTSEQMAQAGQKAQQAIQEASRSGQEAMSKVLEQPNPVPDIIKDFVEKQTEQAKANEESDRARDEAAIARQKSEDDLLKSIVETEGQILAAKAKPKPVDYTIKNPSNSQVIQSFNSNSSAASRLGSVLGSRDLAAEHRANNSNPSMGGEFPSSNGQDHATGIVRGTVYKPVSGGPKF